MGSRQPRAEWIEAGRELHAAVKAAGLSLTEAEQRLGLGKGHVWRAVQGWADPAKVMARLGELGGPADGGQGGAGTDMASGPDQTAEVVVLPVMGMLERVLTFLPHLPHEELVRLRNAVAQEEETRTVVSGIDQQIAELQAQRAQVLAKARGAR